MLRKIFGPKRDKVTKELRNKPSEELSELHTSPKYFLEVK